MTALNASDAAVRERLSLHEAGHVVTAIALDVEVHSTALHDADGHGATLTRPVDPQTDAVVLMGGWAATPLYRADHDIREAVALVGRDGAQDAADQARELLRTRGAAVRAIAEELTRTGYVTGSDCVRIYQASEQAPAAAQ